MRLILLGRAAGRLLCRIGLHRPVRVREITSLKLRDVSPRPDGDMEARFRVTGQRYVTRCRRPRCDRGRDD